VDSFPIILSQDLLSLDMASYTWTNRTGLSASSPCGRYNAAFVRLNDTTLLLVGGESKDGSDTNIALNDAWLLDVRSWAWTQLNTGFSLPYLRGHSVAIVNNIAYLYGGGM
jgi:hypothetical protein